MIAVEKQLDATDRAIIEKIQAGKTYKEIARDLHISPRAVSYRIGEMKQYYKCQSLPQLISTIHKQAA